MSFYSPLTFLFFSSLPSSPMAAPAPSVTSEVPGQSQRHPCQNKHLVAYDIYSLKGTGFTWILLLFLNFFSFLIFFSFSQECCYCYKDMRDPLGPQNSIYWSKPEFLIRPNQFRSSFFTQKTLPEILPNAVIL